MVAIFHDMIEKTMEVFMDDFSVFGDSFSSCLSHLDKMLQRDCSSKYCSVDSCCSCSNEFDCCIRDKKEEAEEKSRRRPLSRLKSPSKSSDSAVCARARKLSDILDSLPHGPQGTSWCKISLQKIKRFFSGKLKNAGVGPSCNPSLSIGTVELSQQLGPNFKVNGHRVEALLWRGRTIIGSPGSPDFSSNGTNENAGGSSRAFMTLSEQNKSLCAARIFPDCDALIACGFAFIHKSSTSSDSFWESKYPNL
ncbi:hypothetical protein Tco_1192386 [Tanacetum coccineum]